MKKDLKKKEITQMPTQNKITVANCLYSIFFLHFQGLLLTIQSSNQGLDNNLVQYQEPIVVPSSFFKAMMFQD